MASPAPRTQFCQLTSDTSFWTLLHTCSAVPDAENCMSIVQKVTVQIGFFVVSFQVQNRRSCPSSSTTTSGNLELRFLTRGKNTVWNTECHFLHFLLVCGKYVCSRNERWILEQWNGLFGICLTNECWIFHSFVFMGKIDCWLSWASCVAKNGVFILLLLFSQGFAWRWDGGTAQGSPKLCFMLKFLRAVSSECFWNTTRAFCLFWTNLRTSRAS